MTSCLKSMLRIAVLSLCAMSALAAFNWDRCDKVNGPEQWAGLCGDKEQSPIDVCGATDNTNVQIAALQFAAGYATDKVYKFRSDGQAYIDASTLGLSMTAGQLAQTVGRSTNSANDTWNLAQAHFHWGRDKTDGSEHYIEGEQYTLELHFVHVNSKYMKEDKPDIGGALASGNADALLVVGQMFEVGDTESAAMTAMIAQMGKGGETGADTTMKASELIDASAGFYSYAGSLTTPTCNAVVTWVVLVSVKTIKATTLSMFMEIGGTDMVSKNGNYRPLQAKGNRVVYKTVNVKSPACNRGGAREPEFACSNVSRMCAGAKYLAITFVLTFLTLNN
mmetsp:Transcript_14915/g.23730  ORF Transcript_14915/g.23730 Transcript_14915/m.23730 type:complete len:336 (-) Transcript_14915:432-1439(-)